MAIIQSKLANEDFSRNFQTNIQRSLNLPASSTQIQSPTISRSISTIMQAQYRGNRGNAVSKLQLHPPNVPCLNTLISLSQSFFSDWHRWFRFNWLWWICENNDLILLKCTKRKKLKYTLFHKSKFNTNIEDFFGNLGWIWLHLPDPCYII